NFPSQQGGFASSPLTATLRNNGTAAIGLGTPFKQGPNPGDFGYTTTCGSSLAAGTTCTFNVTFTPGDMGTRSAQLIVPLTAGGSVGLTMAGPATIRVSVTPNPHVFPTTLVGNQTAPFKFTFKNFSNLSFTINPFEL